MLRLTFRRLGFFLSMCAWWVLAPAAADAQSHSQLFAAVLDSTGSPVLDLTADDFEITIDDRVVAVESVALDTASPKVVMLVDRGHGMNQSRADAALRSALAVFVDTLAPQYEIGIITIAPQVQRREDFTTSREDLKDAISGIFTEQETAAKLMDGMFETWERRFEDDDLFPVFVVVVSEGADDSSYFSQEEYFEFLTDLLRRNATVHAVALSRGLSIPGSALPQLSQHMAENTGGSYQFINQVTGLTGSLTAVAEQINDHGAQVAARYQILFEAPEQQSQVSVRLSRAGLSLQLFADRSLPPAP